VTIQDIVLYNIPAAVINQQSMPPLLGMSLISKFKKIEMSQNNLSIVQ
jgi:predicted aspartyl protease